MAKRIENHLPDLPTVELDELLSFQGALKSADNESLLKLRASLVRNGIVFPLFIWKAPDSHTYLLDGTHRTICLRDLRETGYQIPPVPVVTIDAKSEQEAKDILLLATSQHSKVTRAGLKVFTKDIDTSKFAGEINIQGLNIRSLNQPKRRIETTEPNLKTPDNILQFQVTAQELETIFSDLRAIRAVTDDTDDAAIILKAMGSYAQSTEVTA